MKYLLLAFLLLGCSQETILTNIETDKRQGTTTSFILWAKYETFEVICLREEVNENSSFTTKTILDKMNNETFTGLRGKFVSEGEGIINYNIRGTGNNFTIYLNGYDTREYDFEIPYQSNYQLTITIQ